jgi:SecD/SecF fusion protein
MSDYFERVERRILRGVQAQAPRSRWGRMRFDLLVPAISVAVAVVIAVVFLSVRGGSGTVRSTSTGSGRTVLVYRVVPTGQSRVDRASLNAAIAVMRGRLDSLGSAAAMFQIVGGDSIKVTLPDVANLARAEQQLAMRVRLEFYDWEANALTPTGQTVASQLQSQGRLHARGTTALQISQGGNFGSGGASGGGGLPLYPAVQLATKQPYSSSGHNARFGNDYYVFGAPGSPACVQAAKVRGQAPLAGVHCLLDIPAVAIAPRASSGTVRTVLQQAMPPGVTVGEGQVLVVKQGTVVVQGAPASFASWPVFGSPTARYYVLHDHVALFGNQLTNPHESTGSDGLPDVQFGFTSQGANAFQKLTAQIAVRGEILSTANTSLPQHFAVALDNRLITVPQIDYRVYPAGISGGRGGELAGNFTTASARALATELLPIKLQLVRVLHPTS